MSLLQFEGTYDIKEYKNHNGRTYCFFYEAVSQEDALSKLKKSVDKAVRENGWHSYKIIQISQRK